MQNAAEARSMRGNLSEVFADNPGFSDLILALCNAGDEQQTLAAAPLAPRVLAALRRRRTAAARLRTAFFALASTAAAVAAVLFAWLHFANDMPQPAAQAPTVALDIVSEQRLDGSWVPSRAPDALVPASTALAVLKLIEDEGPAAGEALEKAASFLRACQRPDGSFQPGADAASFRDSTAAADSNLALAAIAILKLYGSGRHPELFSPADGAVTAVRRRLDARSDFTPRQSDLWLAAALGAADGLEWPDTRSGALRNALRRFADSGDPLFKPFAGLTSFTAGLETLEKISTKI